MSIHGNWFRRHEEFRPNCCNNRYENRRYFMDYERNSLFNNEGYGNYGYQPYAHQQNNIFGKFLGFGALALGAGALGFGIAKSGGFAPFFQKIGGFFNRIFGHKQEPAAIQREDISGLKRLESRPAVKVTSSQQQPPSKDNVANELTSRINKQYTVIQTEHGLQLPEVVVTAKRINVVKPIPLTKIETPQPKIDIAKLLASREQPVATQQPQT